MKFGKHHLCRRNPFILVHAYGNSTAVIINHYAVVRPDLHFDSVAVTRSRFIDTIINHLIYQVMETFLTGAAYVHGRSFSHSFKAFQYFYTICTILFCHCFFSFYPSPHITKITGVLSTPEFHTMSIIEPLMA